MNLDLTKIRRPGLSPEQAIEVAAALETLREKVEEAPLGNTSLNRLKIGDAIRFAPVLEMLQKTNENDIRIRVLSATRPYQLRLATAASTRVVLDLHLEGEANPDALADLVEAAGTDLLKLTDIPNIADEEKILTLDNAPDFSIGNMQDFQGLLQPGSHITDYDFVCIAHALTVNRLVDPIAWAYNQGAYEGGTDFSKAVRKLNWNNADALSKFLEARNKMWESVMKAKGQVPRNLMRAPIFVARKRA